MTQRWIHDLCRILSSLRLLIFILQMASANVISRRTATSTSDALLCVPGDIYHPGLVRSISYFEYCSADLNIPSNIGCRCVGQVLECRTPITVSERHSVEFCRSHCWCAGSPAPTSTPAADSSDWSIGAYYPQEDVTDDPAWADLLSDENDNDLLQSLLEDQNKNVQNNQCGGSCSAFSSCSGDCICTALTLVFLFWFSGSCHHQAQVSFSAHHDGLKAKRSNVSTAVSTYAHHTNHTLSINETVAFPAACNETYVSFACANSTTGIVHESRDKWLGG